MVSERVDLSLPKVFVSGDHGCGEGCWKTGSGGSADDEAETRGPSRSPITRAKQLARAQELNQNKGT